MGCDIHLYAEKRVFHHEDEKRENGKWISLDKWSTNEDLVRFPGEKNSKMVIRYEDRFYAGRNYNLFTALAGVRSGCFNGEPPMVSEPKGFPKDASTQTKKEKLSWAADGHSHSFLTLKELKEFDWSSYGETCDTFRLKTMVELEKYKSHYNTDEDIRIVFWFDN